MQGKKFLELLKNLEGFDWNKGNVDKNLIKHNVTNQETEEVFLNEPKIVSEDKKHSLAEKRYLILGITNQGRKLAAIFIIRDNQIRIISARDQNRKERKKYEKT